MQALGVLVGSHHTEGAEICLGLGCSTGAVAKEQDQPSGLPQHSLRVFWTPAFLCAVEIESLEKSSLKAGMDKPLKVINTQLSNYLEWSEGPNHG